MRRREKRAEVLLLAAVSGEIPADWMGEAAGSKEYGAALLTRLKRDGEVKLRSKDGIRGYLLRAKGKRYLLEMYREPQVKRTVAPIWTSLVSAICSLVVETRILISPGKVL